MHPQLCCDHNSDHIFECPIKVRYLSPTTDMGELSWWSGCKYCKVNLQVTFLSGLCPYCTVTPMPNAKILFYPPILSFNQSVYTDHDTSSPFLKEGNKVGKCSTQSGEPQLQWTYWRDNCTIFHEDSCSDCKAWQGLFFLIN